MRIRVPLHKIFVAAAAAVLFTALCCQPAFAGKPAIRFADAGWDSIGLQNRIAGFILEKGLGYKVKYQSVKPGKTLESLCAGKADVVMEAWVDDDPKLYADCINTYKAVDLGPGLPGNWQGWLVPLYMVQGDPQKGVPPVAPGLFSVFDMAGVWELFSTEESPRQGLFYGGVPGWGAAVANGEKLRSYGLDAYYDMLLVESDEALAASLEAAYKEKKPWFGYYWGPTWLLGKYDMVPLAEPPYDPQTWENSKACAFPPARINKVVKMDLLENTPKAAALFINYQVTIEALSETLAQMHENLNNDPKKGAAWFLKNYESLWMSWVPPQVGAKVRAALK